MHKLPTVPIPKARLRVERPIKPLSNTAGETDFIISGVGEKNVTQVIAANSEVQPATAL